MPSHMQRSQPRLREEESPRTLSNVYQYGSDTMVITLTIVIAEIVPFDERPRDLGGVLLVEFLSRLGFEFF